MNFFRGSVMADNRRNRSNQGYDDTDYNTSSRRTRRSSQNTNNQDSRFDTKAVTRSLEEQADSHARRTRRDTSRSSAGYADEDTYTPRRSTQRKSSSRSQRPEIENPTVYDYEAEERYRERKRLRKEAARWRIAHQIVRILIVIVLILDILIFRFGIFQGGFMQVIEVFTNKGSTTTTTTASASDIDLEISEQLLTINEYSRPGTELDAINGIVIHYIGNAGTDAQANRDYFENLQDGSTGVYASSNYIIGLDGTIIQCVPDNEVAYASGERNNDTISIECCHPDDTGEFTDETYNALVQLTAKLCLEYDLTTDQVIRHYDVNGKACPLYFVNNEDGWTQFLSDVAAYLQ